MSVSAVIFDMDGLLVDSEPVYKEAWEGAAAELGFTIDEALYDLLVGHTNVECERIVIEALGASFPLEAFRQLWPRRWWGRIEREGMPVKTGAREILEALGKQRVPVALATSSNRESADACLGATGLDRHFPVIVTVDTVERAKPAPDLFLSAASQLDIAPARCVVIEDSPVGVRAALAAEMRVIVVPDRLTPPPELLPSIHAVHETLHDAHETVIELLG